ncbi:MAG TPA: threonine/serine dehydratase [Myxococcota bacterium]|nr:threonine/serine dehydratase [Myxococcota bacterium]HRY96459.1 threonine/serine dehydratase [Myxococcota bacterium]
MTSPRLPAPEDVRQAAERLRGLVRRTPVLTSRTLDGWAGCQVFLKCENFQSVGAFKFRGATNAVRSLTDAQARRGVATHSSGNHAAALALAARQRGVPAYVVMPDNAPPVKRAAVAGYGATIQGCAPTLPAREAGLREVVERTGAEVVHPYDDARVIAGQGTAALELCEEAGPLDAVLVPVGGGGLASGTCLAAALAAPGTRVFGVEPALADDAARSLETGVLQPPRPPITVADGLRTALSERTFAILRARLAGMRTVSEQDIVGAMRRVWERLKILIEPSSAVPVAALLAEPGAFGKRVGVILSGGNVDLDHLPWCR